MARQVLPRLELLVLKDMSSTDAAQVPAAATIHFYRQGATVKLAVTIPVTVYDADPQPTTVTVYQAGRLAANDTVRVGTGPATLIVSSVNSATEFLLLNNSAAPVTLGTGARLVPTNNRPSVYSDPIGQASLGTSIGTDALGRAAAYLSEDRVDYDIVISGQPTRLYVDGAGQYGRSDQRWNDVRDFGGDLQKAIDALPNEGGVVFVPTGETVLTATILIRKPNVTIQGEQQGSVIRPPEGMANQFDLITVESQNFQLRDLTLDGRAYPGYPNGTKSCLVVRGPALSGNSVAGMGMRNVVVQAAPRYGLWLRDSEQFYAKNCEFAFNVDSGVRIEGVPGTSRDILFEACVSGQNGNRGVDANDITGLLLHSFTCEGNGGGTGELEGPGVEARECQRVALSSCYFEDARTPSRAYQFVSLVQCPCTIVEGAWFQGGINDASEPYRPLRAVLFSNSPASRFSDCGAEEMTDSVALFEGTSQDCVEMGTRDFGAVAGVSRIELAVLRFFGMSRRALGMPIHAGEFALPDGNNVRQGSLAWVEAVQPGQSQLRIYDGSAWRGVAYT